MLARNSLLTINQPHIPDFTNPMGLLVHCHERIEGQLRNLERAAEILRGGDQRSLPQTFAAIEMACAHFATSGVKHTEDEDVSLFPRLRERGGAAGQEALAAMAELESQHRSAEQMHAEFDELVARIPRDGSAEAKDMDRFGEIVADLTSLYRPHIRLENELVFPVAASVLRAEEIQALGEEMRARRRHLLQKLEASR